MREKILVHDETLGKNEEESRPDREMLDVLIGEVVYSTGRGYRLNVYVQGETALEGGGRIVTRIIPVFRENPLDQEVLLKSAKRFHRGTLEKLAEKVKADGSLAKLVEIVSGNYRTTEAAKKAKREQKAQ